MPISTYQISIITPRADAKMQSMYISVRSRTRGHVCTYIIQKGRCQPPADPRRRGATRRTRRARTSVNDPDFCASSKTYEFLRRTLRSLYATPRSLLVLCAVRTAREIHNEYRDYRRPREIISRGWYSLCHWRQRACGFLLFFPTTRFAFIRICIRINLDKATRNTFHSCDRFYHIC